MRSAAAGLLVSKEAAVMTREKGFTLVINSNLEQFLKLWGYTLRKIPERPPRGPRGERKKKKA